MNHVIGPTMKKTLLGPIVLNHWGWVTHICVSKLTIIGSDNGLSPGRRQAIIWTDAEILLIEPLGTNFSEILIEIYRSSFKKMHLKTSSGKCRPFCLGLNVLNHWPRGDEAGPKNAIFKLILQIDIMNTNMKFLWNCRHVNAASLQDLSDD